jgi:hypothetical protein
MTSAREDDAGSSIAVVEGAVSSLAWARGEMSVSIPNAVQDTQEAV